MKKQLIVIKKLTISDWITIIFGVIGLLIGTTLYVSVNKIGKQINIDNQSINKFEGENSLLAYDKGVIDIENYVGGNSVTENYYDSLIDENTSEETLLNYAENAFIAGEYEECIKIYSMKKLSNNAIAQSNLGYLYANGLYFPQSIEIADKYYDKAMKLGSDQALRNKVSLHLKYKMSDAIDIMTEHINDPLIVEFLAFQYTDYLECTYDDKVAHANDFCLYTDENTQLELFEYFYYWEDIGTVYLSYSPDNDDVTQHIKTTEYVWIDDINNSTSTVHIYEKYELRCKGINILEEQFEKCDGEQDR